MYTGNLKARKIWILILYNAQNFERNLMFWNYFQVKKIDLPYDKTKEQRRAFCFVEFKEEDAVKKITDQAVHKIKDQEVRIHVCL